MKEETPVPFDPSKVMDGVKENTLYYTEKYISGKLIDPKTLELSNKVEVKQLELTKDQTKEIVNLLKKDISDNSHKCISVYRDAFIFEGIVYNICLSCGDFFENSFHFFLNEVPVENYINNLKNNK